MPGSFEHGESKVKALQDYLKAVFPNAETRSIKQEMLAPLTLLITSHAVYGFAFCENDMRRDFETTYSTFKKQVVSGIDLRNLEPAFVFCIAPDTSDADQFISSTETDVYFCRKFVIGVSNNISSSLAPLPFMPLAPIDGTALRPTSAQTFLQQSGVPTLLAKQLVVPHERSAEGIFEDCLASKHGTPAGLSIQSPKGMREVTPSDSEVFMERVTICNVRAYRKEQEFKLGKSITVLYGPNGFGKTSFFDAIDFGITGSVGRLHQKNDAHFRKTLQHLDSKGEDAYVKIVYNRNGEQNTILRKVANPMWADLNGLESERKRILSALTNTSTQTTERVDNYISLFRATHLFSQEQQELTKNFHNDCELSTAVVSRMLAVEDYVSANAKAEEVRILLNSAMVACDEEVAELTQDIVKDNLQLESLKAASVELPSPIAIQTEIAEISKRIAREGISVVSGHGDIDALRSQRSVVDGAIGQNRAKLERLKAMVDPVAETPELLSTQRSLDQQLTDKLGEVGNKQEKVNFVIQELDVARQSCAAAEQELTLCRKAVEDHNWFMASLSVYRKSEQTAREADGTLNNELAALGSSQAEEARINDRIRDLGNDGGPIAELLNLKQTQYNRIEHLINLLPIQKHKFQRVQEILVEEQKIQVHHNEQNQEWTVAKSELASEIANADGLTARIARLSADQLRIVSLLEEVESHIEDGICPVCGDDHGSKDALLRNIELRRTIDRSAGFANALSDCNARIKRIRDRLDELESGRSKSASQLRTLSEERAKLEAELQDYATRANEFAVDLFSELGKQSAQQLFLRTTEEIRELRDRLDSTTRAVGEAQALRVKLAAAVKDKQSAVAARTLAKGAAEAVIERLRKDERWNQAFTSATGEELQREAVARLTKLELATSVLTERRNIRDKTQVELEGMRRQTATVNLEITRLRTQLAKTNKRLTTLNADLSFVQLPDNINSAELSGVIDTHLSTLDRLQILRDALIKTELALDAATTAASHVALLSAVRDKEAQKIRALLRKRSYEPWLLFFKDACRFLQTQQAEAIGNFTDQYGPRTSVIQRRLRSVYSFDEIEISEQKTSIVVQVRRGKEKLRPVDYFSQSQQQTLLLGLFLTACSSQTWSSFSSVFLDDPVTHFDDLNTYSLLDLILGLLETDSRHKQFIISTCDDKLLQLAIRKFRHLGLAARFYRFESIGRDGPIVSEIAGRMISEQPKLAG